MGYGLLAGLTWALETIVISFALARSPFVDTSQALVLAPFVSTFLHDTCSAVWMLLYHLVRGRMKGLAEAVRSRGGRWIMLAATIGGPVGMSGYVMSINYMGPSIGAVASAIFPAIGAVLARIFLKERMTLRQWIFLILTLVGVYGLSYSPQIEIRNFLLGLLGTLMCAFGWGLEAVIVAHGLKEESINDEYALQIRQATSGLVYGIVLLPLLGGWPLALQTVTAAPQTLGFLAVAALFATVSYVFYYRAITQIGAAKSMALNVTYAAWALIFTVLYTQDFSLLNPLTVLCTLVVLVCGVWAAADLESFRSVRKKQ